MKEWKYSDRADEWWWVAVTESMKVWTNSDKTDDGLLWEKVWMNAECGLHLMCTNQSPHQEKE